VEEGEVNQNPPNNIANPQPTMAYRIAFSKGDSQLLKQLDEWNTSDAGKTVKEWISEWQFTRRAIKWPVPQNLQANEQSAKQEINNEQAKFLIRKLKGRMQRWVISNPQLIEGTEDYLPISQIETNIINTFVNMHCVYQLRLVANAQRREEGESLRDFADAIRILQKRSGLQYMDDETISTFIFGLDPQLATLLAKHHPGCLPTLNRPHHDGYSR
jgi:hypothetical protein